MKQKFIVQKRIRNCTNKYKKVHQIKVNHQKFLERAESIEGKFHHKITTAIVQEETKKGKTSQKKKIFVESAQKGLESLINGAETFIKELILQNKSKQSKNI